MLSTVRELIRVLILKGFVSPGPWPPRIAREFGDALLELDNKNAGQPHLDCELDDMEEEGNEFECKAGVWKGERACGSKALANSHSCVDESDAVASTNLPFDDHMQKSRRSQHHFSRHA